MRIVMGNVASVARAYASAGVRHLALAWSVDTRERLDLLRDAVGVPMRVRRGARRRPRGCRAASGPPPYTRRPAPRGGAPPPRGGRGPGGPGGGRAPGGPAPSRAPRRGRAGRRPARRLVASRATARAPHRAAAGRGAGPTRTRRCGRVRARRRATAAAAAGGGRGGGGGRRRGGVGGDAPGWAGAGAGRGRRGGGGCGLQGGWPGDPDRPHPMRACRRRPRGGDPVAHRRDRRRAAGADHWRTWCCRATRQYGGTPCISADGKGRCGRGGWAPAGRRSGRRRAGGG